MEPKECRCNLWIYCILIITASLIAFHLVSNIKISPDGMRFGMISEQILSGNGIRVPLVRLEDHYVPVNGTIPFLDQLPLIPILFALMGGLTYESYLPAQALNLISHVAITIFTFLLMKQLCGRKSIALLTGMLVSFSYPLLWATNHISTEPLFIAITVAAIYFLTLSRHSRHSQFRRNFLLAGLCAVVSIMTRNAGIAIIPVFFWEAFVLVKNKRPESKYLSTILAILLPVIATMTIFIRNYIVSGSLRGFEQVSPERSLLEAFTGTVKMMFEQFQLGGNAIILIKFSVLLFIGFVFVSADLRKKLLKSVTEGLDLTIVFMISYTALICLTMAKLQWRYELRFVYPLVPFLFIVTIFMTAFIWERTKLKDFSMLSLAGMILSFSIIFFGTCYKTWLNVPYFLEKQTKVYTILQSCTFKFLKEHYGDGTVITTNKPFHVSFFGGYTTILLPHKRFNPTIRIPNDMISVLPDRMSRLGSQVLVLFEEAEERYDGSYITALFNKRETDDNFILVHECPDGLVYKRRE